MGYNSHKLNEKNIYFARFEYVGVFAVLYGNKDKYQKLR